MISCIPINLTNNHFFRIHAIRIQNHSLYSKEENEKH
jgi:hypothetical protein